jgi:hypothetical protein
MHHVRARIHVDPDHGITGIAPPDVPPGEHEVIITVAPSPARQQPTEEFDVNELPLHDLGPWPEGLSLRREDICGEDGR